MADPRCDPDELGRLVRAGDLAALAQIDHCFGERLLAVGRRRCRDAEEARDAVQDAMIVAATHLHGFRGDGSLEGWLVRIVARACARARRGRKNDPALHTEVTDGVASPCGGRCASPEADAERAELRARLDGALAELDPRDRALVVLAEAEGWTAPELAAHLGMTAEAVRARLSRARRRLRARLADLDDLSG